MKRKIGVGRRAVSARNERWRAIIVHARAGEADPPFFGEPWGAVSNGGLIVEKARLKSAVAELPFRGGASSLEAATLSIPHASY